MRPAFRTGARPTQARLGLEPHPATTGDGNQSEHGVDRKHAYRVAPESAYGGSCADFDPVPCPHETGDHGPAVQTQPSGHENPAIQRDFGKREITAPDEQCLARTVGRDGSVLAHHRRHAVRARARPHAPHSAAPVTRVRGTRSGGARARFGRSERLRRGSHRGSPCPPRRGGRVREPRLGIREWRRVDCRPVARGRPRAYPRMRVGPFGPPDHGAHAPRGRWRRETRCWLRGERVSLRQSRPVHLPRSRCRPVRGTRTPTAGARVPPRRSSGRPPPGGTITIDQSEAEPHPRACRSTRRASRADDQGPEAGGPGTEPHGISLKARTSARYLARKGPEKAKDGADTPEPPSRFISHPRRGGLELDPKVSWCR